MVRIASALGLVMLSVALLILSLISYVSIKRDNIFTTPKYAGSGGPRMYMFHAGFRSQFAMKFLDPSFIPLTNALNEELQDKPSKWKFNRTAFLQQSSTIQRNLEQFAAMMDLLRQTLTAAVQGGARDVGPNPRLQRPTKMIAEDRPEAYLDIFEALALVISCPS
ncbi:UNVERIFIED_CONTAM: hypothetical protein FKN15_000658 [Acipenser sinensis]